MTFLLSLVFSSRAARSRPRVNAALAGRAARHAERHAAQHRGAAELDREVLHVENVRCQAKASRPTVWLAGRHLARSLDAMLGTAVALAVAAAFFGFVSAPLLGVPPGALVISIAAGMFYPSLLRRRVD